MTKPNQAKATSASSVKTSVPSALPWHVDEQMLLDIDNLTVVLGHETVLDKVSFCIHRGEFIGLIGQNGAGKTTLLKVLLGLLPSTSGVIRKDPTAKIGYIPQHGFRYDVQLPISVLEVVRLAAPNQAAARAALVEVAMEDFATHPFTALSGGQQQRVLIAKALASQPELLILDEPTTGIDASSQTQFYQILSQLHAKGITIVMVSHDVDVVLSQVGRVICLNRTILYDGPAQHFEADQFLPNLYSGQHRLLHHQHEGTRHA